MAAVNYRFIAELGGGEFRHGHTWGEGRGEFADEVSLVFFELEAEGAAEDDAVGADTGDDGVEAGRDAEGDFLPIFFVGDFGGEFAKMVDNGFGGGDVFPL